jgi:demethylmenaquinone methyltransferase/2-methoxy-6-polyprenyl-1,4-benzoquinol methylase
MQDKNFTGPKKAQYVEEMFDRISQRYDLLNTLMSGGRHRGWKNITAQTAAKDLAGFALDVATGTGDIAFCLAQQPSITKVTGIDFSNKMLQIAATKASKYPKNTIEFIRSDALSLPFADNSFACATTGFSLRNVTDIRVCLDEMARVVKPGGRIAILEFTPLSGAGLFPKIFNIYFHQLVPRIGQLVARDKAAYTYLPDSVGRFITALALSDLMMDCGLTNVHFRHFGLKTVALHTGQIPTN